MRDKVGDGKKISQQREKGQDSLLQKTQSKLAAAN